MRIVVASDFHGDATTAGVPRFEEVARAAHATVSHAIEKKADLYLFLGDLCDPDAGPVVFRCVELAMRCALRLKAAGITSVWIAGNHCVLTDGSGETVLSPLRALEEEERREPSGVNVCERPRSFLFQSHGVMICALPYAAASHSYDPAKWLEAELRSLPKSSPLKVIVAAHMTELAGARIGSETREMPRGRGIPFPEEAARHPSVVARLNGHWHRQQVTPGGVQIPGSLARLRFDEEDNSPSFLSLEV